MNTWRRRAAGYAAFLATTMVATAVAYRWGMATFENESVTLLHSLQVVVEMFTTTGFGGDSPWESGQMNVFVAVMDLVGMALLIGALPVLARPLLENALSTTVPRAADDGLSDHVVICSYTTRMGELIDELESLAVPYVIVEPDRERAVELYEDGHRVIRVDPESTDGLAAAGLPAARAAVADVSDQVDASIVLAAKELAEDVPVLSVVQDPDLARYHRLAGADRVLSPRSLLGESLASKVTTAERTRIEEAVEIGEDIELAEVSVGHGTDLAGTTLADSGIRERTGVNVIGAWFRGEFDASPSPDATLSPGTVLLVSGRHDQLEALVELIRSGIRRFAAGETLVVGHGEVGRTVTAALDDAGVPYEVVDREPSADVDVVGDATEPGTFDGIDVADLRTIVLALPEDTTTEFATLVLRDLAPETEIVARVEEQGAVPKVYRAGADYALSLAMVTGRMAAARILEDRDVLSLDQGVEVVRTPAPGIVGRTLAEADVRDETGCTVVAVERDGTTLTDIGPDTRVESDDRLVVVGTDDGVREFERTFG